MLDKWNARWLIARSGENPPEMNAYSSYHLHKLLEDLERGLASAEDMTIDHGMHWWSDNVVREAIVVQIGYLRTELLKRFRSQLDSQHERELIEDWKGAFDGD